MELVLHTDSSSAKAVLLNRGLSRRVRHLDIAVCYLQERIQAAGSLKVVWCPTSAMVADILTKCLSLELFGRHQGALGIFKDETVQRVQMICGFKLHGSDFDEGLDFERIFELCDESDVGQLDCEKSVDRNSFCSSSGGDRIPSLGSCDHSLEMTTAVQSQEVAAPFWCKTCKWLFKSEDSCGLTQTKEGETVRYDCGKRKSEITVTGSAAQHAFNMREKDKTKRWGSKGEGKGSAPEKAPTTPAPSIAGKGDPFEMAPITPAPGWMMETISWFSDLGGEDSTPDWYKALREAVCRKGDTRACSHLFEAYFPHDTCLHCSMRAQGLWLRHKLRDFWAPFHLCTLARTGSSPFNLSFWALLLHGLADLRSFALANPGTLPPGIVCCY